MCKSLIQPQPRTGAPASGETRRRGSLARIMSKVSAGAFGLLMAVAGLELGSSVARASATTIYIAQTAAGSANGSSCANAYAVTFFNTSSNWGSSASQIGPGTTVHLCGTFNGSANSTEFTFQGSGTASQPITMLFESGAQLNAPYWSGSSGAINTNGHSFLVINGGTNGIIQNTANGDQLANRSISILIYAGSCQNCTIQNLNLANDYVAVQNQSTLGGPSTQMNAIYFSGSNWTINNNIIHDCGWCLYNVYGNGDNNIQVYNNNIYNWDHAYMFATAGPNQASNFFFYNNQVHDNVNWETPGCIYHLDGIHFFGTAGSSMSGQYVYNNYFYGNLSGGCSSGFIFMEGGSSTPSNASNTYIWNNIFDASGADGVNPNGWVGVFSGVSGTTQLYNNYIAGPSSSDTTNCYNVGSVNNLVFENNAAYHCTLGNNIGSLTGTATVDYNFYDHPCNGTNNCFIYNSSFMGSFAAWKTASGFDAHSITTASDAAAMLNPDGSPQPGSPLLNAGANWTTMATGSLASLGWDTTKGGTRAALLQRPAPMTGWTIGAYVSEPNSPANLSANAH